MYYLPNVLKAKCGSRLSKCWLAVTLNFSQLKKDKEIFTINLSETCTDIIENRIVLAEKINTVRFSLYLKAQLMYGAFKIYKIKIERFLAEVNSKQKEITKLLTQSNIVEVAPGTIHDVYGVPNAPPLSLQAPKKDLNSIEEIDFPIFSPVDEALKHMENWQDWGKFTSMESFCDIREGIQESDTLAHVNQFEYSRTPTKRAVCDPEKSETPSKRSRIQASLFSITNENSNTVCDQVQTGSMLTDQPKQHQSIHQIFDESEQEKRTEVQPVDVQPEEVQLEQGEILQNSLEHFELVPIDENILTEKNKKRRIVRFFDKINKLDGNQMRNHIGNKEIHTLPIHEIRRNLYYQRPPAKKLFEFPSICWRKKSVFHYSEKFIANFQMMTMSAVGNGDASLREKSTENYIKLNAPSNGPSEATLINSHSVKNPPEVHTRQFVNHVTGNVDLSSAERNLAKEPELPQVSVEISSPQKSSSKSSNAIADVSQISLESQSSSEAISLSDLFNQIQICWDAGEYIIRYDELIPPENATKSQAITCFYYCLILANRGKIRLEQKDPESEIFIKKP